MRPNITMMYGDGTVIEDFWDISPETIKSAVFFRTHNATGEFDRLVLALVSAGF